MSHSELSQEPCGIRRESDKLFSDFDLPTALIKLKELFNGQR
jgi:hypothetical protein